MARKLHPAPIPFSSPFLPFSSSQLARPQPWIGASTTTQAKRSISGVNGSLRRLMAAEVDDLRRRRVGDFCAVADVPFELSRRGLAFAQWRLCPVALLSFALLRHVHSKVELDAA